MIFSELYGAYYNAVAKIIERAIEHPLKKGELADIVSEFAFGESILNIESAIQEERWQLIKKDGTTPIVHNPSMPMTELQKKWLKAISMDPRIQLFEDVIAENLRKETVTQVQEEQRIPSRINPGRNTPRYSN